MSTYALPFGARRGDVLGIADPAAGGMRGADMVIGWVDDATGEASVVDAYALTYTTPITDTCQDWTVRASAQNASHTMLELSRALDTGDLQDRQLAALAGGHAHRTMAALGSADKVMYHGEGVSTFRARRR